MRMTLMRWLGGVVLGCAAVAFAFLPFPASTAESFSGRFPTPLATEVARFSDVAARADAAVRSYRTAQGLDRWNANRVGRDTSKIRVDASVPDGVAAAIRAVADEQWTALGSPASGAHAQIFVYADSSTIPRVSDANKVRRPLEPRGLVDVRFVLPEGTDGTHCVSVVRLRALAPENVRALRSHSLLGVCGFFAAFGMPGNGVRAWLTATGYRTALRSDWHIARAPAIDATALYYLSDIGGRCLTGERGACALALRVGDRAGQSTGGSMGAAVIDASVPVSAAIGGRKPLLGDAESEVLVAAVRELGAERFAAFWRSPAEPEQAFAAAFGVSLDAWTHVWAARTYGAAPARRTVSVRDVVWLAIAAPVLLAIAARRRERVLLERLVASRA
ncbi:MAG TPA: hypothetical protein VM076_03710 [Gemmatimonadaceae bacterium]|nr:hypothetical protein [Gemmatimonadaceae bacterium]